MNGDGDDRVTAPDTVIIFTRGSYTHEGVPEALEKLRRKNARIVSVNVGRSKKFKQKNIDALAIGNMDVYDLENVQSTEFIDDIAPSTCKMTSCTSGKLKKVNNHFAFIK